MTLAEPNDRLEERLETPMFSGRTNWAASANRLTQAREELARQGREILDLTISNPTEVAIEYPTVEISEAFARAARAPYRPDPRGLVSAREALAENLSTSGDPVSPDDLLLTASTSEAYSFLFKLLADPGQEVLTAAPTYPLLDRIAALEGLTLSHFTLELERRWSINASDLKRAMTPGTAAVVVVHPNNPTGSYLLDVEQESTSEVCASRGVALISDEVFHDYPLEAPPDLAGPAARRGTALAFSLGGLSKSAGLPHLKLGWIRVGGAPAAKRGALAALESIADDFLSVATPVQEALPDLLRLAPRIRDSIRTRTRRNLETLTTAIVQFPQLKRLTVEGGWSVVLRVPRRGGDEAQAVELLERDSVLIHPGWFFDFAQEGFLVLSLLPQEETFAEGVRRLVHLLESPDRPET